MKSSHPGGTNTCTVLIYVQYRLTVHRSNVFTIDSIETIQYRITVHQSNVFTTDSIVTIQVGEYFNSKNILKWVTKNMTD